MKSKQVVFPMMLFIVAANLHLGFAQEKHYFQTDFSIEDFTSRRSKIFDGIGNKAIALLQGPNGNASFGVFRQINNFYYLCGIESAHAYLLLNGGNRKSILYLPHRDEGRERGEGKTLSAEDAELIKQLTGVDDVKGLEFLSSDLVRTGVLRPPAPALYISLSPAENGPDSRDELLAAQAYISSDPWDGQPSREAH